MSAKSVFEWADEEDLRQADNKDRLDKVREWLIDNVFRNPDIMLLSDRDIEGIDLPEVIASLYNEYHKAVTGESYDYMFHWANKVGSWVEEDLFDKVLNESGVTDEEA